MTMKKHPLQKAEEYLQKAKDILNNTPVEDLFEDGSYLRYTDVKSIKKAGRTAWKGCSIALEYALEIPMSYNSYYEFEKAIMEVAGDYYPVINSSYLLLNGTLWCDGNQHKPICDIAMNDAEELVKWCKNRQSIVEQHEEEEKRTREEYWKKHKEDKKLNERIVKRQKKELLELMLEKADLKKKDIIEMALNKWIANNLDLLTDEEKKRFDHLVF